VDNDNTAPAGEVSYLICLLRLPIKRTMHQAEARQAWRRALPYHQSRAAQDQMRAKIKTAIIVAALLAWIVIAGHRHELFLSTL